MLDIYREKQVRVVIKVAVPVKEHPKVSCPKLINYVMCPIKNIQELPLSRKVALMFLHAYREQLGGPNLTYADGLVNVRYYFAVL